MLQTSLIFSVTISLSSLVGLSSAQDWHDVEESLEAAYKDNDDGAAVNHIETLVSLFPSIEKESEQKKLVKVIVKALSERRPEDENMLLFAAVESFAELGETR